jgi:hypothetical protein
MKSEIEQVLLDELPKKRVLIANAFADGEKRLQEAITEDHKYNMDTSKPLPDGKPALDEVLRSLLANRDAAFRRSTTKSSKQRRILPDTSITIERVRSLHSFGLSRPYSRRPARPEGSRHLKVAMPALIRVR